jgi:hypothetical protein
MGAIIESITSMSEGIVTIQELLAGSKTVAMVWTTLDYWKKFLKWTTGT